MSEEKEKIDALETELLKAETLVEFEGRKTQFRSTQNTLQAIDHFKRKVPRRNRRTLAVHRNGT